MFHDDLLPLYINFIDISLRFERPPTSIQPLQNTIYRHSCFCPILSSFYISLKAFDQSFVAKKKHRTPTLSPPKEMTSGLWQKPNCEFLVTTGILNSFVAFFYIFFSLRFLVNECIFIKWGKLSYSVTHIHNSYIHTYTLRHTHTHIEISKVSQMHFRNRNTKYHKTE